MLFLASPQLLPAFALCSVLTSLFFVIFADGKIIMNHQYQKNSEEQRLILDKTIEEWRNHVEQIDDILVIGIKI